MDITKYLKNKDVTITNEDFDIDKMEKDIRKGFLSENDLKDKYVAKTDYDKLDSDYKKASTDYTTLESNFNNLNKTLTDTNEKLSSTSLEKNMAVMRFNEKDFQDVAKIRSSIYADEKDDKKALGEIATKFKATYFPESNVIVPNEPGIGSVNGNAGNEQKPSVNVNRNTALSELVVKATN